MWIKLALKKSHVPWRWKTQSAHCWPQSCECLPRESSKQWGRDGTRQGWKREYKSTSVFEAPLSTRIYLQELKIDYSEVMFHSFTILSWFLSFHLVHFPLVKSPWLYNKTWQYQLLLDLSWCQCRLQNHNLPRMHCCNLIQFPFILVDRVVYNNAVITFKSCGGFSLSSSSHWLLWQHTPYQYGHTDHYITI